LFKQADTPYLATFSQPFNDLLHLLLQKDPTERPSWDALCKHPFWQNPLETLPIPEQPHFNKYKSNSILKNISDISNLPKAKTQEKEVNIMRLSMNIKKNQNKESNLYM
jgi:serine/threonine protein kinase